MLKQIAGSVGACALFFLFLSSFLPFVFLCCFLAALRGGCGWLFSWLARLQTFLIDSSIQTCLRRHSVARWPNPLSEITPENWTSVPGVSCQSFLSFGPFVPRTSVEFSCGNSLTSFRNCWVFILVYLCVWDPITNPLIGQDMIKVESFISASFAMFTILVRQFRSLICTKQAASAKTSPFWRYLHLHLLSSSR